MPASGESGMDVQTYRDMVDSGMVGDGYFAAQERIAARKDGYKVWGINPDTATPYIVERGFEDADEARTFIAEQGQQGQWFVKAAEESDPDFYASGEAGFWRRLSDEEYDYFSEMSDRGLLYD